MDANERDTSPAKPEHCAATIVVCTHNGAHRVLRTIRSLLSQTMSADAFEILVIVNASTDSTYEVVTKAIPTQRVRCLIEPRLGLSVARNRALQEAKAGVVCFIDDDATASPQWLESLLRRFSDPAVGAAGGQVELAWPATAPKWFCPPMIGLFSGVDHSGKEWLREPDFPFGTNMAMRRRLALQVGGFREDLGRVGTSLVSFEEYDFFRRLSAAGSLIAYCHDANVKHHVAPARVSLRWLLRRSLANGVSEAIMDSATDRPKSFVRGMSAGIRAGAYIVRAGVAPKHSGPGGSSTVLDLSRGLHWAGRAATHLKATIVPQTRD